MLSRLRSANMTLIRRLGPLAVVAVLIVSGASVWAQPPSTKTKSSGSGKGAAPAKGAASAKAGSVKSAQPEPKSRATAPDVEAKSEPAPNTGPSAKYLPSEVFRDPNALKLLDVTRFPESRARPVVPAEVEALKAMAADANVTLDPNLIDRVVEAEAARLTNHANILALIDPPVNTNPNSPTVHAINDATKTLLEPIFAARSIKNINFLRRYDKALITKLQPLLKNHLIPRIQAMIILGQSASSDDLPIYLAELKNATQTVWVKLWALEGLSNLIDTGGRPSAAVQIEAAKAVADFLERDEDLPWPAQYRALQALAAMRQGFVPSSPKQAHMASSAMRLLSDGDAKPEVRAEAARALGMMQITTAVPRYNYPLVAHAVGELAATIGAQISATYGTNPLKARYLTALLAGPVYESFDGAPGARESGLIHETTGEPAAYAEKVFELVKAVIKGSADLLVSASRQIPTRLKDLDARVEALKSHLQKNPPPDRRLVQGGPEYPSTMGGQAALPAAHAAPVAGATAARR